MILNLSGGPRAEAPPPWGAPLKPERGGGTRVWM